MKTALPLLLISLISCSGTNPVAEIQKTGAAIHSEPVEKITLTCMPAPVRCIHVFVALCDNMNQGIVKVPDKIGDGQNPATNLYWGAGYGVSSFFKKSTQWKLVGQPACNKPVLQRLLFRHKADTNVYLLADAYDGAFIKQCTQDFMDASAGIFPVAVTYQNKNYAFGSCASLLSYIGHDGLMEFELDRLPEQNDGMKREVIILACVSQSFFAVPLARSGAQPLVWTKGLMAPEAYTLHDCVEGWIKKESKAEIRKRAARTYEKYQKLPAGGANYLFSCEWP